MKKIRFSVLLIVIVIIAQMLALGVYAESLKKDGELKLNVEVGYKGLVKLGNITPMFFEVQNNLKDINGELQVEILDEYENITIYSINISLPKNTTKQFVMHVPITRLPDKLNINIVQGKTKVMTKTIRPAAPLPADTLIIGMLSDDYESIRYIDKIPVKYNNNLRTAAIKLDEATLPDNVDALKMFNVLIVNNYDTSKLSAVQYDALKTWVNNGGLLIIGTGPSYTKTLAAFKDDFITGEINDVSKITTASLYGIMDKVTSSEPMEIDVLDIKLEGAAAIAAEGALPLIQKLDKGKGVVAIAAFDFGLEPLTGWVGNKSFSESLISRVLPAYYSSAYFEKMLYMNSNYYAIDNSLRSIPELPQPNPLSLLIIFAVYILITAPISYIILKKLDKRELMWVTVPVISIVFAVVMYLTGYGTRLTEPMANVISIINIDNSGFTSPATYAGIFTPNKTNMKVETDADASLKPFNVNHGYMYGGVRENEEKKIVSKVVLAPKPAVEFYSAGIWSMRNIIIGGNKLEEGIIESNLNYTSKKITGTIKNMTKLDLEDCYLITNNQYVQIGSIKSGESISIDNASKGYYGGRYDLVSLLYDEPQYHNASPSKLTREQINKYRMNMQKRQILDYYFWSYGEDSLNIKLIGWSKTPVAGSIIVNGNPVKKIEKSFVTAAVNLNFIQGNKVEYPMGFIRPNISNNLTQGHYDEIGRMFYGRGTVELSFPIGKNIQPEEIVMECKGVSANVKKYIFNNSKQDWEEFSGESFSISESKMSDFIKDSSLSFKFELSDDNLPLPQISLKGSVK